MSGLARMVEIDLIRWLSPNPQIHSDAPDPATVSRTLDIERRNRRPFCDFVLSV